MSTDQAREIAERVARRISTGSGGASTLDQPKSEVGAELAAVRAGLSELQEKLAQLEAKVTTSSSDNRIANAGAGAFTRSNAAPVTHSPWLAGINAPYTHPSQEKFGVEEATVTELVDFLEKEKVCNVEPGGKPCDHCSMCSSRGF